MGKRLAGKRGQAFVEYLVIIVLVIAALLALRVIVGPQLTATYNEVGNKSTTMTGTVTAATPEL